MESISTGVIDMTPFDRIDIHGPDGYTCVTKCKGCGKVYRSLNPEQCPDCEKTPDGGWYVPDCFAADLEASLTQPNVVVDERKSP